MGGLSSVTGGEGGLSASGGAAGDATSGGTSSFNISSGGGSGFNPFQTQSNISQPHMLMMVGGVLLIGYLLIKKKK